MTEEDKQINHLVGRLHSIEFEFSSLDGERLMDIGLILKIRPYNFMPVPIIAKPLCL